MAVGRHYARIVLMQSIYQWEFAGCKKDLHTYVDSNAIQANLDARTTAFIDAIQEILQNKITDVRRMLQKYAPEFPLDKISSVDRAILYIGATELLFGDTKETPSIVAIDEAIEIAKDYGSENSSKFINGVLSKMYEKEVKH